MGSVSVKFKEATGQVRSVVSRKRSILHDLEWKFVSRVSRKESVGDCGGPLVNTAPTRGHCLERSVRKVLLESVLVFRIYGPQLLRRLCRFRHLRIFASGQFVPTRLGSNATAFSDNGTHDDVSPTPPLLPLVTDAPTKSPQKWYQQEQQKM